jgi:uracil-DNA glycosylase
MIDYTHPSWHDILKKSIQSLDKEYLDFLYKDDRYFPDINTLFSAFKLPLTETRYILFGQDPYPRRESAIGYAFIDGSVNEIFSQKGLSKEVNRATSLRNFIKMLLVANGDLKEDLSQEMIAKLDKSNYIKTMLDLKNNFEANGILLLNMALIFTKKEESKKHIKEWRIFVKSLLKQLQDRDIKLILFGNISKEIEKFDEAKAFKKLFMPHPYNISFIRNKTTLELFAPMQLLTHQYLDRENQENRKVHHLPSPSA